MSKGAITAVVIGIVVAAAVAAGFFAQSGSNDKADTKQPDGPSGQTAQTADLPAFLREPGVVLKETVDATGQAEVTVSVDDFFFNPSVLTVSKGTKVTWTNEGSAIHTVTSKQDSPNQVLDSGDLSSGDSYSYTFDETGEYLYFCVPHPVNMRGVVYVVE